MNAANAAVAVGADETRTHSVELLAVSDDDGVPLLPALTALFHDTVGMLDGTIARVTDLVMRRSDRPERELVMTLQDFDRRLQEFAAIGEALMRYAAAEGAEGSGRDTLLNHVTAALSVSDLNERLLRHLRPPIALDAEPADLSEVEF